jgi:hypothetical protein
MENQISHESLYRVEPTAKNVSESNQKQAADAGTVERGILNEREVKSLQTEMSNESRSVENDLEQRGNRKRQKSSSKKKKKAKKSGKNRFLGGQLFDMEA